MITKNIPEKYNKMYDIYLWIYWNKCLYKWQKSTLLGSSSSKKPRISVETVYEKQNRNMDLLLKLLETTIVRVNSAYLTKIRRKKSLQI